MRDHAARADNRQVREAFSRTNLHTRAATRVATWRAHALGVVLLAVALQAMAPLLRAAERPGWLSGVAAAFCVQSGGTRFDEAGSRPDGHRDNPRACEACSTCATIGDLPPRAFGFAPGERTLDTAGLARREHRHATGDAIAWPNPRGPPPRHAV